MPTPVYITSHAVLTPLDSAGASTFNALLAGARLANAGPIDDHLLPPLPHADKSTRLALAVAQQALRDTSARDIPLFLGTSKGPVYSFLNSIKPPDYVGGAERLSLATHIAYGLDTTAHQLRHALQLKSTTHTSVAACSSGLHALHRAVRSVQHNETSCALVVATDASLHDLFTGSFARLGVLAKPDPDGQRRCDPFDPRGKGFFLSEAAAAILIESQPRTPTDIRIDDSWIGADGNDIIQIDANTQTLRYGLSKLAPSPDQLAFVHAHATGTSHDTHELAAVRAVLGHTVEVFSHKKHIGHTLGAAGLISVVLSATCHQRGISLTNNPLHAPTSLTISQGFGGHIAIVRLSRG